MNEITDARVGLSFSQCNEQALILRASLAKSIGLHEATRVIALLNTDLGMEVGKHYTLRHGVSGAKPSPGGAIRVGDWSIRKDSDGVCFASVANQEMEDYIRLKGSNGRVYLQLKTETSQSPVGSRSKSVVTIGHHPAPTIMDGHFYVEDIGDFVWISGLMSSADISYVREGGVIDIRDIGTSRSESREPNESIGRAIDAIQHC